MKAVEFLGHDVLLPTLKPLHGGRSHHVDVVELGQNDAGLVENGVTPQRWASSVASAGERSELVVAPLVEKM
jgi:hypothetical protein